MCHQMYQGTSFQPFSGVLSKFELDFLTFSLAMLPTVMPWI